MDEDTLMRRAAAGDTAAFGRLVTAYQDVVWRAAARLLGGDGEAAGDAAQEAFLRLWRARTSYRSCGRFRAFLFSLVRTACLDLRRAMRPETGPGADFAACEDSDAAAGAEAGALAEAVRRAIGRLPEEQQVVFVLSHYEGLTYAEIAVAVGCPVGTVASRKRLAVAALRRALAAWAE